MYYRYHKVENKLVGVVVRLIVATKLTSLPKATEFVAATEANVWV